MKKNRQFTPLEKKDLVNKQKHNLEKNGRSESVVGIK